MTRRRPISFQGCGVYAIRCSVTGMQYIGSTSSFGARWIEHTRALDAGTHPNYKLQRDWRMYGRGAFSFVVLERCHPDDRLDREQWYIDHYRAVAQGYNINPYTRPTERAALSSKQMARKLARTSFRRR